MGKNPKIVLFSLLSTKIVVFLLLSAKIVLFLLFFTKNHIIFAAFG
ncbi:hypothetical protein T06_67 [Trichinella sp. T6]|nr:hypothetical protein T06_67 [Trichinella sp. T6]